MPLIVSYIVQKIDTPLAKLIHNQTLRCKNIRSTYCSSVNSPRFSSVAIAVTHGNDECTALDFVELILAIK